MKKKITLAVADFALPTPRQGSIDVYSGFGPGQAFGLQTHQEIQQLRAKEYSTYEAEVWIQQKFTSGQYIFDVSGRIDGIFQEKKIKIEEIKTAFDLNKLLDYVTKNEDHPYCLQLKTYGYIFWLKTKMIPALNLHLVSSRNKKSIDHIVTLDIKQYEQWLSRRLKELVKEIKSAEKNVKRRKALSTSLSFPFHSPRPGQKELIERVNEGMKKSLPLLIQAPTGLGKTMGILFPALKESLQRGQKVVYLTPKNSQHLVALDAVKTIQASGSAVKSLVLTAKRKICMKQEPLCNAQYCEFAENHYTKVAEHHLLGKLKKEKKLTAYSFKKMAEQYQVCPYELQMDAISFVETVICDYNYVFSPSATGNRVLKLGIGETEKPSVIIDELHNLPTRAMDYYSPFLSALFLEKLGSGLETIPVNLRDNFQSLLQKGISIIKECGLTNIKMPHIIIPAITLFKDQEALLREFLTRYLESDVVLGPNDPVLTLFNDWSDFTAALEWVTEGKKEFFIAYYPHLLTVKITCCDASAMLKGSYENFAQVVGFSATLKPFDFYSQLTGLQSKKLITEEFFSPFPKEKRKLIIIPQISSKYVDRIRNYPRIVEVLIKITALKQGNYFAFFPSFQFLEKVLEQFQPPLGMKVISQTRGMRQDQVQHVLNQLSEKDSAHLIFAVQGGVFSEGIDYPGSLAIGAFVIGTPLPHFDWEREKMKEYYQRQYLKGEEYAYIYPAMAKAIQAAGRVIRSETDKGIIILMDDRFLQSSYSQCMPKDWFKNSPQEMISQGILNEITQFWCS
ncbi:MAG: ATP-dependent DNA helicase [Gammaproteobacteria bacterium]|nr:ATP-dependent DNA helicase [Gammaproteobacteria bacterium]